MTAPIWALEVAASSAMELATMEAISESVSGAGR